VLPPFWDFASSGLETGLSFAWLGLSFWALVAIHAARAGGSTAVPRGGFAATAVLIGLGPLVRPDLAIFSAGFLVVLIAVRTPARKRTLVALAAAALALPAAYQLFRMGYFGAVVPNTAFVKEAGTSRWDQGWKYLRNLTDPYVLAFPLALAMLAFNSLVVRAATRRERRTALLVVTPVACGIAHALYVVKVGGDFIHARLLLPSLFGILLPVMAVALVPRGRWAPYALPIVLFFGWGLVVATSIRPPAGFVVPEPGTPTVTDYIVDERAHYVEGARHEHPVDLEDYNREGSWVAIGHDLRRTAARGERTALLLYPGPRGLRPSSSVAAPVVAIVPDLGMRGFAAGRRVHIADVLGLADPLTARFGLLTRGRPGHEKRLSDAWGYARFVDPATGPFASQGAPRELVEETEAARAALRCGELREVLDAAQKPLTPARFIDNIGVALRTARLRVPGSPEHARGELCG
jgi:arabinofuranosyltransferase